MKSGSSGVYGAAFMLLTLSVCAAPVGAQTNESTTCNIEGLWQTPNENGGVVEILQSEGVWIGQARPTRDSEQSVTILKDVEYDEDDERYEGELSPPERRSVSVTIVCKGPDVLELKAGNRLRSRTFEWTRLSP